MSNSDEQKKPDPEVNDDALAPDDASPAADDGATMADPDDTASVAASDGGATFVENTMAPDAGSPGKEPAPESATLPLEQESASSDAGKTIPAQDEESDEGSPADHTLADPNLAGGPALVDENDGATVELPDGPASADVQQTMFDDSLAKPGVPDGATSDATMMESVDNPDATRMEDSSGGSTDDRTMMESDYQSASGGDGYEGTQILDESAGPGGESKPPRRPKKKGAHETADRWEHEQRYHLVSNFARGGLGQIWMASDSRLRREVAFKELLPSALKNQNAVERFLEEAQITGQLEHPSIVPIYDIGYQQNGTPFYAMKLVRGDTMEKAFEHFHELPKDSSEWLLTRRKLLGNFIDVCNAIAFAHDRGVLHRDLKPLNVMLGAFGETLVLDWGLAKVLDELAESTAPEGSPITANPGGYSVDDKTMNETAAATGVGGATGPATTEAATQILNSTDGVEETIVGSGTGRTASATAGATAAAATAGATAAGGATAGHSQATFGRSRHVHTDVRTSGSQTMQGSIMGTPAYMPPEQAKGSLDEVDARTDIYSLGGILYKLLTNQQPIKKGRNIKELLKRVVEGEIIPPREHEPVIEKQLEAVCLKALARKREDRYQTALELAADVEAFLAGEPVSCFEDPPVVKAKRWARKNPKTVTGSLATVTAIVAVAVGSSVVHASALAEIRSFAAGQVATAQTAAAESRFDEAEEALTEAIGRAGSEPDLADLKQSLENRQALIEQTRIQQLESDSKRRLQVALDDFRAGRLGNARTSLAEVLARIGDEESLATIQSDADKLLTRIEKTIAEQDEMLATQKRFEQFRTLADETRALASMPDSAKPLEDAQLAVVIGQTALKLFDLIQEKPLAVTPKWFDEDLPWVVAFEKENGKSPLDVLREDAFELMIIQADLELTLAGGGPDKELKAAATRALDWVTRARTLGIPSQIALVWEAIALRLLGRDVEADQVKAAADRIQPSTVVDFFLLGEEARKAQRFEEALKHYLDAIRIDPSRYWTQHCIGLCYLMGLRIPEAAVSAFSSAASLREGYARPIMLRAVAYGQMGLFKQALDDFEVAIKIDPELFDIYINRGALLLRVGRSEEALADFKTAGQLDPASPLPALNTAAWHIQESRLIRAKKGRFADMNDLDRFAADTSALTAALAELAKAEAKKNASRHPGIHALFGKVYSRQEKDELALAEFQKHVDLARTASDQARSLKQIGFIHLRNSRSALALTAFQLADRILPGDLETTYFLGEASLGLPDRQQAAKEALAYFEKFNSLVRRQVEGEIFEPENLYTGIATALNILNQKNEAIEYYTLAIKHNPILPAALTRRGWAYASIGLDLAKADFENAKKQNPENADTLIGLGFTLAKLGDGQAAKDELTAGVAQAVKQLADEKVTPEQTRLGWTLFFNASTGFAQAYNSARSDTSVPSETLQVEVNALGSLTLSHLDKALTQAATTGQLAIAVRSMETDRELEPVRNSPGFQQLLQNAKEALKPSALEAKPATESN
jgi:serine/threonine protein kinase/Tfp pilus assembly protein PilF